MKFKTITVYCVYYTDRDYDDVSGYERNDNYHYFYNHDDAIKLAHEINTSDNHWLCNDAVTWPIEITIPLFTNNPAIQRHPFVVNQYKRIAKTMQPLGYIIDEIE